MAEKKGGKFPESFIAIIIIIILMYFVVNGGLVGGGGHSGGGGEVLSGDGVTRAVPASGNLTPQPDYHLND